MTTAKKPQLPPPPRVPSPVDDLIAFARSAARSDESEYGQAILTVVKQLQTAQRQYEDKSRGGSSGAVRVAILVRAVRALITVYRGRSGYDPEWALE